MPKDAEGEVARILGCRTYYEVLEVGDDTDEESVRKAHRRKALLVHPDKCSSPHAKAAFQRVQDGFILLKGTHNSCGLTRIPFAHATMFVEQTRHRSASTTIFFQGQSPCKLPALLPMQAMRALLGHGTGNEAEEAGADVLREILAWRAARSWCWLGVGARHHAGSAHVRRQSLLPCRAVMRKNQSHCGVSASGVRGGVLHFAFRPHHHRLLKKPVHRTVDDAAHPKLPVAERVEGLIEVANSFHQSFAEHRRIMRRIRHGEAPR